MLVQSILGLCTLRPTLATEHTQPSQTNILACTNNWYFCTSIVPMYFDYKFVSVCILTAHHGFALPLRLPLSLGTRK